MGGETDQVSREELRSALGWWLEAGVDVATSDERRDWLKPAQPVAAARHETVAPPEPLVTDAATLPDSLDGFLAWLRDADTLPFSSPAAKRFLPAGGLDAPIMLLADMPALDGAPGDGPIGGQQWALAQRMIAAIGIDPALAYRASLSCFHAVTGLGAGPELKACGEIARRHVALARPKRLLLLGNTPCQALLGKSLAEARGHVHTVEGVKAVASFPLSLLMNQTTQKKAAWADLLLLTEDR